jgi:membrane dipeptidase
MSPLWGVVLPVPSRRQRLVTERRHESALVVDLHCDTVLRWASGKATLSRRGRGGHIDLPHLRAGRVGVQVFALYVAPRFAPERSHAQARDLLRAFRKEVGRHRGAVGLATSLAQIRRLHRAGKVAAVLSIENGDAIEDDLDRLTAFYRAGVRMMSLTWNPSNRLADGAMEHRLGGITAFGRQVVRRMQELGMIVDVSHLSEKSFWDVVRMTRGPIIASHSDAAAIQPHPRNLRDDQIRALAARGGVIGINFYPDFLGAPSLERVAQHVDHMVSHGGLGCVAMGSDFDGISWAPRGLENASRFPALGRVLERRGYSVAEVAQIMGGNAMRVFGTVWGK